MDNSENAARARTRVAYLNCNNATFFLADALLSPADAARLSTILAWLEEFGALVTPADPSTSDKPISLDDLIANLRASFGDIAVGAALGCDAAGPMGDRVRPAAVMPMFPLSPEGDDPQDRDVLLGSARLWGTELLVEMLRVDGPDDPVPVASVRSRLQRWSNAAGDGSARAAVQPPGHDGWYAVAAISAPA